MVVRFVFLRLIEEVGLQWLGLLPAADAHTDEPHRLARQVAVKKKRPSLPQDHSLVVGRDWERVLAGVGLVAAQDLEEYERITVESYPQDQVRQMIAGGEIHDAKTITTLSLYWLGER